MISPPDDQACADRTPIPDKRARRQHARFQNIAIAVATDVYTMEDPQETPQSRGKHRAAFQPIAQSQA
jgi:hypothetical protein